MHSSTVSNTTSHNCTYLTQKRPPNFIFQLERQEEIYFWREEAEIPTFRY